MNGPCCQTRYSLFKWPALLALALMLSQPVDRPLLAAPEATTTMRTIENGPVELTISVDRDNVRVADPFHVTLTATAPQGVRVQFPDMGDRLGELLITRTDDAFDVPNGANRTWTRLLRLESLTSGNRELPPITLTYTDTRAATANNAGTIATPTLPVTVVSEVEANADPTRFRDIKGTVELFEPVEASYAWIAWTAIGVSILALAGFWLFVVPRRSLNARQWALRELDRLEKSGLIEEKEFDTFFCRVTDILRTYIERRFAIRAPHLPTPEFLALAETREDFDVDQRQVLKAFLKLGDFVKFARFNLTAIDADKALTQSRRFIEATSQDITTKRSMQEDTTADTHSIGV